MDENIPMLYHFSLSIDDSVDENVDTGKIRGWFVGKLRNLKPQDLSLPSAIQRGRTLLGCIWVCKICRRDFSCHGLRFLSLFPFGFVFFISSFLSSFVFYNSILPHSIFLQFKDGWRFPPPPPPCEILSQVYTHMPTSDNLLPLEHNLIHQLYPFFGFYIDGFA